MNLIRITLVPGGRDGLAKPVGKTVTHYYMLRHDRWELVEPEDLPLNLRIYKPFEYGTSDYEALPPLAAALTRHLRGTQQDVPEEVRAQVVGEVIGEDEHQVFWVAYPPFVELADNLITNLPPHFFYSLPPGKLVEFVLEPARGRFERATT